MHLGIAGSSSSKWKKNRRRDVMI